MFPVKLDFYEALLEVEQRMKNAPPEPEEIVLTRRLCHALDLDTIQTKLVALRVLTKCIRDGSVSVRDLGALRDGPLPEPEPTPGIGTTTMLNSAYDLPPKPSPIEQARVLRERLYGWIARGRR